MIQGLISLNNGDYVPTRWQATLLIFASVIGIGMFNVFGAKHLPLAEGIFLSCHIFALFPIIIILLVLAPKQPASAVFTEFKDNGANYPTIVWNVFVGQVNAMFIVLGESAFGPLVLRLNLSSRETHHLFRLRLRCPHGGRNRKRQYDCSEEHGVDLPSKSPIHICSSSYFFVLHRRRL